MARRKQEVALQTELDTQEDWEGALSKEGLLVVDIYQEWAGPCVGMVSNFRRIKNELGDDLLRFAVAKSDTIDSLERYRGKCEPCFLLYASGTLVYSVKGAQAPVLSKVIPEQLAAEHKVLAGEAERQGIRDPMYDEKPEKAEMDAEESEKEEIEVEKEVTVCLIKPDAVEAGKVEEIMEQLEAHGLEILKQEVRQLTEEEAKSFYAAHEEEEYFEELVKFMCSGPSHVLVLSECTGENTISKFRDLIGPKMVEEAKETAPDSLRAQYGTTSMTNALHGSDDKDKAMKELAFFFPDYAVPTRKITQRKPKVQRTLALIRPDALREHKDEIINKIKESGFQIAFQKEVQLSKEQAEEFYKEHEGQEYFDELTTRMSSGPLLALALARVDAVDGWRDLLGPKEIPTAKEAAPESLRAQFSVEEDLINPLHGSDSFSKAEEELKYFFPMQQTVAVVKPDAYQTKDEIIKRIHEAGFRIAARKETQLTKDIAEQMYGELKEKEFFDSLTEHVSSGQTLFLVLSREDAVDGWRSLIGPTNPEDAKEKAPSSIRAELGVDVEKNAVHGSSNEEHAKKEMQLIFGEMEFNEDGTVKGEEPDLDAAVVEKDSEETGEEQAEGEATEAAEGEGAVTEGAEGAEGAEGTEGAVEGAEGTEGAAEGAEGAEGTAEGTEGTEGAAEGTEAAAEGTEATEGTADAAEQQETTEQTTEEAGGEATEAAPESTEQAAEVEQTTDGINADESSEAPAPVTEGDQQAEEPAQEGADAPAESAEPAAEADAAPAEESAEQAPESTEQTTEEEAPAGNAEAMQEVGEVDAPSDSIEAPPAESSEAPADSGEAAAPESAEAPAAEGADAPAETTDAPAAAEGEQAPAASSEAAADSEKKEEEVEQVAQ